MMTLYDLNLMYTKVKKLEELDIFAKDILQIQWVCFEKTYEFYYRKRMVTNYVLNFERLSQCRWL